MATYKLADVMYTPIEYTGIIGSLKHWRYYKDTGTLSVNSETQHLSFKGQKEQIDFGVPSSIEFILMRAPFHVLIVLVAIFGAMFFSFQPICSLLDCNPSEALGGQIFTALLFLFSMVMYALKGAWLKITYLEPNGTQRIAYINPNKYFGGENYPEPFNSLYAADDKRAITSQHLYQCLAKYYTGKPDPNVSVPVIVTKKANLIPSKFSKWVTFARIAIPIAIILGLIIWQQINPPADQEEYTETFQTE